VRPVRIEAEGFTAFRKRVVVSFEDAELFAFVGPTGAGKSSLIDAMVFALYGKVPRYQDDRAVAPAINAQSAEARVRLDFEVEGARYTAVRVVRRTKTGATTKEARLERDDQVLAGDARELDDAVAKLLGLSFEQFTKTVVLPQGEFARFLHEKPSERQDLLVQLLGLGLYDRMRELAAQRATKAKVDIELADGRLADLVDATPEARKALGGRVKLLVNLVRSIEEAQSELDRLGGVADAARAEAATLAERAARLEGLAVPADVHEMAAKAKAVAGELKQRRSAAEAAALILDQAEAAHDPQVDRSGLEATVRDHERRDKVAARLLTGEAKQVEARTTEGEAREATAAADAALSAAEGALEQARRADLAQALVPTLVVGAPCPVCAQTIVHLPEHRSAEIADVTRAREAAVVALAAATAAQAEAVRALDKIEVTLTDVREQMAELDQALEGRPPLVAARSQLDAHVRAERDLANARAADREARDNLAKITSSSERLVDRERELRRSFDQQRDALAALSPPAPTGERLGDDWAALLDWADAQRPVLQERADAASAQATEADEERAALVTRIDQFCREIDIGLAGREPLVVAVEERTRAESQLAALDESLARRTTLEAEREMAKKRAQVARSLATHLKADHFERWVLDEAHELLLESATAKLEVLAGGAYSLAIDERRQFLVIDHANADTERLARTLSGGETFLVSLALALALADQIAGLAAGGAVQLESIFLDEGFGSLDHDTLEIVATAIEELGAQGRMVGVVTHVRDLAERLPVRFEVRKGPAGSTVERVTL